MSDFRIWELSLTAVPRNILGYSCSFYKRKWLIRCLFNIWLWTWCFEVSMISSVQFSHSVMSDSLWPHELQHARPPCPITNSQSLLKLMSIESVMPSSHLILCRPLLLLPPIPPSIRVFSNESTLCMRWKKYWSFSFSIIPSKEIPGLIL